jgi:FRG domain
MPSGWASRLGEDLEPRSWTECVGLLLSSGGDDALYRGQRRFEWELLASLERALLGHAELHDQRRYELLMSMSADSATDDWVRGVELELMQRFRQRAMHFGLPQLPEASDILGWWELMQHHGAPTRLMDWTTSPFIAIWFALDAHEDGDGDMALWIYDRATANRNLQPQIDRVRACEDYELLDDRQVQNRLAKYAIEARTGTLVPVRPRQFARAVAQQSILTVSPDIGVGRPASWMIRNQLATRIRLKQTWKPEMQAACQSMGLSRAGLFRDLDSLGRSIAADYMNNVKRSDLY